MSLRDEIIKVKSDHPDWGYRLIAKCVGCQHSTVRYHLDPLGKTKMRARVQKHRYNTHPISKKLKAFKYGCNGRLKGISFEEISQEDVLSKIGFSPVCYLSGRPIDILRPSSYEFDHIIPISKGGRATLNNLGLSRKEANRAKSDLSREEFIELCRDVLVNNGYTVERP